MIGKKVLEKNKKKLKNFSKAKVDHREKAILVRITSQCSQSRKKNAVIQSSQVPYKKKKKKKRTCEAGVNVCIGREMYIGKSAYR
jgi:hypothetical protein